jgi:enoyl-CoA hydratase/carnithine racemase
VEHQPTNLGRVDLIVEGHLLVIRINRPEKRNGFTPEMGLALAQAYTRLEQDPDLRVAILCAEGEHFTGGLDLPRWAESMREGRSMWPSDLVDPFDLREPRRSKPVVAAVQGICYTLGIELMLAADMVVAADNCRFSQLEVKRGIMATGGATVRMAERAGTGTALYHLLVAGEFGAEEAHRVGYVQEIVPAARLFERARELAQCIAENAPLAVVASRRNVLLSVEQGRDQAIAAFRAVQSGLAASEDAAEGLASFKERRAARFKGR